MTASRRDLIPISAGIERSRELDCFFRFLPHDHGLQFGFTNDNRAGVEKYLYACSMLCLRRVQINPCSIAERGLVTSNVEVVLYSYSRPVKGPLL
jgi:hypothetical protein